jgi:hypothetical protein
MPITEEQISLADLLQKLKEWFAYLKSKWLTIVIVGLVGAILGFAYSRLVKPTYKADLTFVLSSNSKTSSLASLAGQFGLDIGSMTDDVFEGDNIIELFKSQRIIKGALFKKVDDSSKTLINLFIEETELQKAWKQKENIKDLIPFPDDVTKLTPVQDSLVSEIHDMIIKRYLTLDKVDKKLSFYNVSTKSEYGNLSYYLTTYVAKEAANFYIETKTKTAKQNLNMLQHEADSIRNLLGGFITSTAEATDQTFNLNPAYQVHRTPVQQNQIGVSVLGAAYTEIVKNLEIAKITLQKETPLYQIIDTPFMPLKRIKVSGIITGAAGGFFAGLFIVLYLLVKKKPAVKTREEA